MVEALSQLDGVLVDVVVVVVRDSMAWAMWSLVFLF